MASVFDILHPSSTSYFKVVQATLFLVLFANARWITFSSHSYGMPTILSGT